MRIGEDVTVPREMLADRAHARSLEAPDERARELRDRLRIRMKRAIADYPASAVLHVQDRREREVDAMSAQLGGQHEPQILGQLARARPVAIPRLSQRAHWRNRRESLAESLHPPAFVVHCYDERRMAHGVYVRGEPHKLLRRGVVAGEQDDASRQRVREALAIGIGQRGARHVQHRPARAGARSLSCLP